MKFKYLFVLLLVTASLGAYTTPDDTPQSILSNGRTSLAFTSSDNIAVLTENSGANQVIFIAVATSTVDVQVETLGFVSPFYEYQLNDGTNFNFTNQGPDRLIPGLVYNFIGNNTSHPLRIYITDSQGNSTVFIDNLINGSSQNFVLDPNVDYSNYTKLYVCNSHPSMSGTFNVATGLNWIITYSLKPGEDSSSLSIDSTTGEVTLIEDPDFESKSSYAFTVVATDPSGNISEKAVTLAINDVEETAASVEEDPSWVPQGWVYYAWPYAYSFSEGRWYFFNESDTQWRVNMTSGVWGTLDVASGWNYYAWPYSYSFDEGAWHWYNNDTQWVVDLFSGEWATFGGYED